MPIRNWLICLTLLLAVTLIIDLGWQPGTGRAQESSDDVTIIEHKDIDTCLGCHGDKVPAEHFTASVHGKLVCQDCHKVIDRFPHPDSALGKLPKCESCHTREATSLTHSIHGGNGKASDKRPKCQSCHGLNPHEISKPTALSPREREASCRNCHADQASTLAGSVHGQASRKYGGGPVNCLKCHGGNPHAIAAPVKTASAKQDAVCRKCHAADVRMMLDSAHGRAITSAGKSLNCLSCHGDNPHAISSPQKKDLTSKASMCVTCHADQGARLAQSAHGKSDMLSEQRPDCLTCHGQQIHQVATAAQLAPKRDASCRKCHANVSQALAESIHTRIDPKTGKKIDCLSCHGGNPHTVHPIAQWSKQDKEAGCKSCHQVLSPYLNESVHEQPDKIPGDHPTCLTCHGGSPHTIKQPAKLTARQKVALCSRCHANKQLMARYGRTDAVEAYERTNHGKAIAGLGSNHAATCVDCHGIHGILPTTDPRSRTTPQHAAEICGKCHKDKRMDFAFSYATHLRMNVEKTIIDPLAHMLISLVYAGIGLGLLGMVSFGIRRITAPVKTGADWVTAIYETLNLLLLFGAMTMLTTASVLWKLQHDGRPVFFLPALILLGIAVVGLLLRAVLGGKAK